MAVWQFGFFSKKVPEVTLQIERETAVARAEGMIRDTEHQAADLTEKARKLRASMSAADDQQPIVPSLCRLIRAAADAHSQQELNDAFFDLHKAAWPIFRPRIAWGLAQRRVSGLGGLGSSLDEPEDIYNELLQRIAKNARAVRGRTDAEVEAWLTFQGVDSATQSPAFGARRVVLQDRRIHVF